MADELQETDPWMLEAQAVLKFLREFDAVSAVDLDVWLFKSNTDEQLATFLRERPVIPHDSH